jgi:hypothetical protein
MLEIIKTPLRTKWPIAEQRNPAEGYVVLGSMDILVGGGK